MTFLCFMYSKSEPIAQTDELELMELFVRRMRLFGIRTKVEESNVPADIRESFFFSDIELIDVRPHISMILTNQELQSLYDHLTNMSYNIQESVKFLQMSAVFIKMSEEEKESYDTMIELIDNMTIDIIEGNDAGYILFDSYFDVPRVIRDMYTGELDSTLI